MILLFSILYAISFVISVLTIAVTVAAAFYKSNMPQIFPQTFQSYLIISYQFCVILNAFATSSIAVMFFITDKPNVLTLNILRSVTILTQQNIRNFFIAVILERIAITVYFTAPTFIRNIVYFIFTIFFHLLTFSTFAFFYYIPFLYRIFTHIIFGQYVFVMTIFTLMYFLNVRMFKVTAYRVTLKRRHEILRNVKVLSFMFPPMLIHTSIAPLGSLISIIGFFHQLPVIPYCVFHMFYNLPQLIIMSRHILLSIRRKNTQISNTESFVKNVLGKSMPAKFTTELYFISLNRQWN